MTRVRFEIDANADHVRFKIDGQVFELRVDDDGAHQSRLERNLWYGRQLTIAFSRMTGISLKTEPNIPVPTLEDEQAWQAMWHEDDTALVPRVQGERTPRSTEAVLIRDECIFHRCPQPAACAVRCKCPELRQSGKP